MKFNFQFNYGAMVNPEKGLFVDADRLLRDSAAEVADALTKEAERIGSEGNEADVKFADKLESLACKLDDAFKE